MADLSSLGGFNAVFTVELVFPRLTKFHALRQGFELV